MIRRTFGGLARFCHMPIRGSIGVAVLVAAESLSCAHESTKCGTNIISAAVVATFCGHREGREQRLDLMILWRGAPGWFQRHDVGRYGSGGSARSGGTTNGYVAQYSRYGNVTTSFEADFDANTAKIGDQVVAIDTVNTILVDRVDAPGAAKIVAMRRIEPHLPLIGDENLMVVQRSTELLDYLRCDVPMPRSSTPQPAVMTVCEKLKAKQ